MLTKYDPYDSKYQFLLEFKYIKLKDEKLKFKTEDGKTETKYENVKRGHTNKNILNLIT
ncbi:MAG: hypothetical protein IPG53_01710 [Ignavibacteriales bacterium]|nr:hypothetical protein [Ignavibacteriales bacterium]